MLAPALGPVLLRSHLNTSGECAHGSPACPPLRFLDQRGEGNERWLSVHLRSLLSERNLIKDALSEPTQPAVECRIVGREFALGGGGRRAKALIAGEIRVAQCLDATQGVLLVGKDIGRQDPPAVVAAGTATGERDTQDHPLSCGGDEGAGNQLLGQVEGLPCPAAEARQAIEPGLDDGELSAIDGSLKLGMVER
jgi:hypothetical protein